MKIRINLDPVLLGVFVGCAVISFINENTLGVIGFANATMLQVANMKMGGLIARALFYNQLLRAFYTAHKGQLPPGMPQEQVDKFKQLMGE